MLIRCKHCGATFEGVVFQFNKKWIAFCNGCGNHTAVNLPEGKVIIAFADDSVPEFDQKNFCDDYRDGFIRTYYPFDDPAAFWKKWRELAEHPDGMWYWVVADGKTICSGACDPEDEYIFNDYFRDNTEKWKGWENDG